MYINRILILTMALAAGCSSSHPNTSMAADSFSSLEKATPGSELDQQFDTTGFLSNCQHFRTHLGSLQGTKASKDSISNLGFAACYDCPQTYQIIFTYKTGVTQNSTKDYTIIGEALDKGCENSYADFNCVAFVAPMRDPERQEDIHASKFDFPLIVRAYRRLEADKWKAVGVKTVMSFEEYANFQFKTIYGLN